MKLYDLSFKELWLLNWEFKKTQFGRRASTCSTVPMLIFLLFIFEALFENEYDTTNLLILFIGCSITQLQYGNMLKDYINSKK